MSFRTSTFSIVACDPDSGELGVAVQSRFLAVGSLVPGVRCGTGAVATQAKTNSCFIGKALDLLERGIEPQDAIHRLVCDDPEPDVRQIGIVDVKGRSSGYTGKGCIEWAGHKVGVNFCCQGNVLLGPVVLDKMAETYESTQGDLPQRLLAALFAAEKAGGERRGRQSSALIVERHLPGMLGESDRSVDIRVDNSFWPIDELKKLLEIHRVEFSANHRDKCYPFEGETRKKFVEILRNMGYVRVLGATETIESVIDRLYGTFSVERPEGEGNISGELVHRVVERWYEVEYERMKEDLG